MSRQTELENVKEAIFKATSTSETSCKADRLIEEFTRKVIDQSNPLQSLNWLKSRTHDLGQSGSAEDLKEAISVNYFTIGFMIAWIATKRLELMEAAESPNKSQ